MPLSAPPAPTELAELPRARIAGQRLHRVVRTGRATPWWFASLPRSEAPRSQDAAPGFDPDDHGRFDLPLPLGACYLARTPIAAVLEAFQHFGRGMLPTGELRARRLATVTAPATAPVLANVAVPGARGVGITAALWAGGDRRLTQAWAWALSRAGWRGIQHGVQHDPAGRLRAVTLFDEHGEHAPYGDDASWAAVVSSLHDDDALLRGLERYGLAVTRDDVSLPVIGLEDSGLL